MPKLVSMKFKKIFKYLSLIALTALLILAAFFLKTTTKAKLSLNDEVFKSQNYQKFENFTKKNGVKKTYQILKEKYPNNDTIAHNFAHIVGFEALRQDGISGLEICDTSYNYGCHHGFVEVYLKKFGVESVKDIENSCKKLGPVHTPSCIHGIGHGVMVVDTYDIKKALWDCDLLDEQSRIFCWDGAFMERVTGSMLGDDFKLEIDDSNLDEPCISIEEKYQEQCFRNQVTVWYKFFENSIGKVASRCSQTKESYQKTCFESIGLMNVMVTVGDPQRIINNCLTLNNDALDFCFIGSLKEFLFEGKSPQIAKSFCEFINPKNRAECHAQYNIHVEQFNERFGKDTT